MQETEFDADNDISQFGFEYDVSTEQDELLDQYVDADGYQSPKSISEKDIKNLYRRDNIVHRRINKQLMDMFGQPPDVICEDEDLRNQIKKFLFSRDGLYQKLKTASKHSFLDGLCLIYLNYGDNDLGSEPDQIDEIHQIGLIFNRDVGSPILQKRDITRKDYNQVTGWNALNQQIHKSRIIEVSFDTLYNDPKGIPLIEPEFDYHLMRKSVIQDAIQSYHQNASGIKIFKLPEKPSSKDVQWLKENVRNIRGKGELIAPSGTEIEFPAPKVTDPNDYINPLMEMGTSMPYQILAGTSAGTISGSETNLKNYKKEIQNIRQTDLNDWIIEKIEFLQQKGYFDEGEFELDWGDITEISEEQQASIDFKRARAGVSLYEIGYDKDVIDRFLGITGGKAGLSGSQEEEQQEQEHICDYPDEYKDPSRDFCINIDLEDKDKLWDELSDDDVSKIVDKLEIPSKSRMQNHFISDMRTWMDDLQEEWIQEIDDIFNENESIFERIKEKLFSTSKYSKEIGEEEDLITAIIQITGLGRTQLRGILNELYSESFLQGYNSVTDMPIDQITGYAETWLNNNASYRSLFTSQDLNNTIKDNLIRGIRDGYTTSQLEDRISENISDYTHRVETLARTELNYSLNQGRLDAYEEKGVDKVTILVVQDDRTCDECMALDGVILSIDEARMMLPIHPNCRCVIISTDDYRGVDL